MRRGTTVYSKSACGDWTPETGSVVIPKGIKATYDGIREHPPSGGIPVGKRAFFLIPDSPGQKMLCCCPDQIDTFWSRAPIKPDPPPPPPPPAPYEKLSCWERLRRNPYTI